MFVAISLPAFAVEFAGGTGASDDPYEIDTREQSISIGQDPNLSDKHFAPAGHIDPDPNLPGGQVFTRAVVAPDADPAKNDFQGVVFTGGLADCRAGDFRRRDEGSDLHRMQW